MEDWEVLSDSEPDQADSDDAAVGSPRANFDGIDGDAEGIIRHDYFSLDNQGRYAKAAADASEEGSVESDNPSWIDPGSVTPYGGREAGGFWSDTASDRSDGRKSNDFDAKSELGFPGNEKTQVGFGETEAAGEKLGEFGSGRGELGGSGAETQVGFEEIEEMRSVDKDLGKFWSDSGGDGLVSVKFEKAEVENETGFRELDSGSSLEKEPETEASAESQSAEVEEAKSEAKTGGEVVKRTILWWKVPLEVLKYCVFRVSPVWSISVAAAVMGLVFLGRRLYKMKRKSQSLQLKVTLDDKKVSQFMTRAARLNEAFSVVKRVPVLRPSLPATGVNPWPVMSLR